MPLIFIPCFRYAPVLTGPVNYYIPGALKIQAFYAIWRPSPRPAPLPYGPESYPIHKMSVLQTIISLVRAHKMGFIWYNI